MIQIEAIHADGVFKPSKRLDLPEQQRVQITIQPIVPRASDDRQAALEQLLQKMRNSGLRLTGPLPTRDELHERD